MYPKIKTKNILKLAGPEFVIQLIIVGASTVEMFYVSKLSVAAVAVLSVGSIVTMMINNFFGEVEVGARASSAKFVGERNYNLLSKAFFISILIPAFLGGVIVLFRSLIGSWMFYLIGDGSLYQLGASYLSTSLLAVPFALIFFSLNGFICGMGDTLSPLFIRIIMHLIQISLGYFLIFGVCGLPKFGVHGVAITTIFVYSLGTLLSIFVILNKKVISIKNGLKLLRFEFLSKSSCLKSYLNVSFDIGMQFGLSEVAMYLFVMIIGWHGVNTLVVHQIAYYQVFLSMQLPLYCFYTAASVIIGQTIGEKRFLWVIPATNKILNLAISICFVLGLVVFLFSYEISHIFSPIDIGIASSAAMAIKLLCVNTIIEAFYIVVSGCLIGTYDSRFVMKYGLVVEFFLLLPLCYLLSWILGWGIIGACLAMCLRSIANCFIVGWRFFIVRQWDVSEKLLHTQKTLESVANTESIYAHEIRNIDVIVNNLLDEGIIVPVKLFEKNSQKKLAKN